MSEYGSATSSAAGQQYRGLNDGSSQGFPGHDNYRGSGGGDHLNSAAMMTSRASAVRIPSMSLPASSVEDQSPHLSSSRLQSRLMEQFRAEQQRAANEAAALSGDGLGMFACVCCFALESLCFSLSLTLTHSVQL